MVSGRAPNALFHSYPRAYASCVLFPSAPDTRAFLSLLKLLDSSLLAAFPWRGEHVRMALPTRLPPTLGGWAQKRRAGTTEGAKLWDRSVPLRAAQQRGRFVRSALRGALVGCASLHASGLLHQSLSPAAILLSTDDDKTAGETLKSYLTELSFCRDQRSLQLAYRTDSEGEMLAAFEETSDPLDNGLIQRTLRRTVRPGDPAERTAFAVADEIREFGMLMLEAFVLMNAPPDQQTSGGDGAGEGAGEGAPAMTSLRLRSLCDSTFCAADADGFKSDGIDVPALRAYLDAEDGLRVGGVGGVEMLDKAGKAAPTSAAALSGYAGQSGWDLIAWMTSPTWEERPTAAQALEHPFWKAPMFF